MQPRAVHTSEDYVRILHCYHPQAFTRPVDPNSDTASLTVRDTATARNGRYPTQEQAQEHGQGRKHFCKFMHTQLEIQPVWMCISFTSAEVK